jgi:hypothetical protein
VRRDEVAEGHVHDRDRRRQVVIGRLEPSFRRVVPVAERLRRATNRVEQRRTRPLVGKLLAELLGRAAGLVRDPLERLDHGPEERGELLAGSLGIIERGLDRRLGLGERLLHALGLDARATSHVGFEARHMRFEGVLDARFESDELELETEERADRRDRLLYGVRFLIERVERLDSIAKDAARTALAGRQVGRAVRA